MSLVEVLVGAGVFTLSASCSLQVWSSTARWSQHAERQRQEQQQLEAQLLAVQGVLQQGGGEPLALSCREAWQQLASAVHAPATAVDGEGRVQVTVTGPLGGQRQRWFDPAAYGLCGVAPALPLSAAGESTDGDAGEGVATQGEATEPPVPVDPVPEEPAAELASSDGALPLLLPQEVGNGL